MPRAAPKPDRRTAKVVKKSTRASRGHGGCRDASATRPLGPLLEKPLRPLLAVGHQVTNQLAAAIELRGVVEILDIKLDDPDPDILVAVGQYRVRATQFVDLRYKIEFLPERQIAGEFIA